MLILVPLDGSLLAERALLPAAHFASAARANLLLARVLPHELAADRQIDELPVQDAHVYLESVAARHVSSGSVVDTCVTFAESAAPEIVRLADERAADLIVMSTHGRSGLGRWLYGSVADEVLRDAHAPVMLVPPEARIELDVEGSQRIVVPLDGSDMSEAALGPARDWASRLNAELVLVQAVAWPPIVYGDGAELIAIDPDEEINIASDYLQEVAARWQSDNVPIRYRAALGRPVPTIIHRLANEERADLIAMATHGRSGLARLVLGSVATGILQRADMPLLLVRPPSLTDEQAGQRSAARTAAASPGSD